VSTLLSLASIKHYK